MPAYLEFYVRYKKFKDFTKSATQDVYVPSSLSTDSSSVVHVHWCFALFILALILWFTFSVLFADKNYLNMSHAFD